MKSALQLQIFCYANLYWLSINVLNYIIVIRLYSADFFWQFDLDTQTNKKNKYNAKQPIYRTAKICFRTLHSSFYL